MKKALARHEAAERMNHLTNSISNASLDVEMDVRHADGDAAAYVSLSVFVSSPKSCFTECRLQPRIWLASRVASSTLR